MSKKRNLPSSDHMQNQLIEIDWNICLICQQKTKYVDLVQPTVQGYKSLSVNLNSYAQFKPLPPHLYTENLVNLCIENQAKYHKVCRTRFNNQKINRISKNKKLRVDEHSLENYEEDRNVTIHDVTFSITNSSTSNYSVNSTELVCLFCGDKGSEYLVSSKKQNFSSSIFENALFVEDETIITKLSNRKDVITSNVRYHKRCYAKFLNNVRKKKTEESSTITFYGTYKLILDELVTFIQENQKHNKTSQGFHLSNLLNIAVLRLKESGFENAHVNRTRLKQSLCDLIPGLRHDKIGKEVVLSFEDDVGKSMKIAFDKENQSYCNEEDCLSRAAKILREEIINNDYPQFDGSFDDNFTPKICVPPKTVRFLRMLLEGSAKEDLENCNNRDNLNEPKISNAILSIAQLVIFNSVKRVRNDLSKLSRHNMRHETPLPLYIGLLLYNQTGGSHIINKLFHLGLSVSYTRINNLMNSVTSSICDYYDVEGCVSPTSVINNVFTCAAIDNVDHDTSSNTSNGSFHGTSISLIQYPTLEDCTPPPVRLNLSQSKQAARMPDTYTTLPPTPKLRGEVPMSLVNTFELEEQNIENPAKVSNWLESKGSFGEISNLKPFSSFFSESEQTSFTLNKCKTTLLPLINEDINSPSVVRHATNIVNSVVKRINPKQPIVITADQPVYALLNNLQWTMPSEYGEDKIMVLLGGLHIEMAFSSAVGAWLEGSGWTDNLVEANVTTPGRAEGILKVYHLKRSRYAHEVSVITLQVLLEKAYQNRPKDFGETFDEWVQRRSKESAQFMFWKTAKELECFLLDLVRSIRQGRFAEFVHVLERLTPWMFALDHTNYARWLPVFLNNVKQLHELHPVLFNEFSKGNVFGSKTNRRFSRMSHDQIHEQNNKLIKSGNNLSHLSRDKELLQWMVAGPEVARMIKEFERDPLDGKNFEDHHEDTRSFQLRFQTHVSALIKVFVEHGNPFEENNLTAVNASRIVFSEDHAESVFKAYDIGKKQFDEYVNDRLVLRNVSINEVIKKNNLLLMRSKKLNVKTKEKQMISDLRKDSNIFAKLYVASQTRQMDVNTFFSYENTSCPPSISDTGKLRKPSKKSDIVPCIIGTSGFSNNVTHAPDVSSLIIDGAALVHILAPQSCRTFEEYFDVVFKPYILMRLKTVNRVDLVFDRYFEESLKNETRESRGSGQRVSIKPNASIPKSFTKFLANGKNKEELFGFLAEKMIEQVWPEGKEIVCTVKEVVKGSIKEKVFENISPASHEEADSRLLLHAWDAMENGHANVLVKTVDSDVVVIAVYALTKLEILEELWVEYGTGKHMQYIPVHEINKTIPKSIPSLLPFFHAFTGVDTVSGFAGIGKTKAWKTWMAFRDVDKAFEYYTGMPENLSEDDHSFSLIQRFTVLLYHPTSSASTVNEARRVLYTKHNRAIENIPPTSSVLLEHIKRACHQCNQWVHFQQRDQRIPDPCSWGWTKVEGGFVPVWSLNKAITMEMLKELVSCKCKELCKRCRCVKLGLKCTLLCSCEGACNR